MGRINGSSLLEHGELRSIELGTLWASNRRSPRIDEACSVAVISAAYLGRQPADYIP